jgi:diguanylate cyclase (GGDEF)-like protein
VGILQRKALLDTLARPYGMDLHVHSTIASLMDASPMLVEANLHLQQVSRLVTSRARLYKDDDFIVVRQQRFIGIAQVIDLLRQITELQLQTARHANPLTMLPGNIPINDCINSLLAEKRPFVFCYFDVDHFKPFNDYCGYSKGDEALLMLAQLLQRYSSASGDFIGHVGGDDFIGIFQSQKWIEPVAQVMNRFSEMVKSYYSEVERNTSGFFAKDRYGEIRFHSFLSLSVCAIEVEQKSGLTSADISYRAAELKKMAKSVSGNCLIHQSGKDVKVYSGCIDVHNIGLR